MTERLGSTRIMRPVEPGIISLTWTDFWSAFDRGRSHQIIPGIGASRCACAVKSFELAHVAGVATHFTEQVDPLTIHVQEFSVPRREPLSGKVHGSVLDAEWIYRNRVFGSLHSRLARDEVRPEHLGFASGTIVTEGMKLPRMHRGCTTKFETVDRHLTNAEAQARTGITAVEWEEVWILIRRFVDAINQGYEAAGFYVPDGKLEIGRCTASRKFIVLDVGGTPDENRIIDAVTGQIFGKDIIRNYLDSLPWKKEFDQAKEQYPRDKSKWPPYPALPPDVVGLVSSRYAEVAGRYAGVSL